MQAALTPPWRSPLLFSTRSRATAQPRPAKQWLAVLIPSVADIIFLAVLAVCVHAGSFMLSADGDPARHLTVGEHMLATGRIMDRDVFSHTMGGEHFVPYEWLAEVGSAASYRLAGLAGPLLLHGVAVAASVALLFGQLRSRGAGVLLAVGLTVLAAATSSVHWLARPHVFTLLGAAVFSTLLDRWQRGTLSNRWLWLLPPLMIVWANAHGGFLIGLILLGTYVGADVLRLLAADVVIRDAAAARLRRLVPVAGATALATLINPAGPALLVHVSGYFDKRLLVDRTLEYKSPDFHLADVRPFTAMLLGSLGLLAWSGRRPALHDALLLTGFTYFALYSGRNIPLFALVAAPALVSLLRGLDLSTRIVAPVQRLAARAAAWLTMRDAAYTRVDERARGHLWPVVVVAALLALASAQWSNGTPPLDAAFGTKQQPVAAVQFLKEHPPTGNVFNNFAWGGYLLHELWPSQRVFIDGQTDFYGEALTREYLDVSELASGWRDVLDRHDVRWVIFPTDSSLVRALKDDDGWSLAYEDHLASVLVRDKEHVGPAR